MTKKEKIRKTIIVFILAFILNLIWENLHSQFYIYYQGQEITQLILIRAALFDASFITIVFIVLTNFKIKLWWAIIIGIAFAIFLEHYALATNRWAYTEMMPIIPILKTGLTPTIQLGLLSIISYKLAGIKK